MTLDSLLVYKSGATAEAPAYDRLPDKHRFRNERELVLAIKSIFRSTTWAWISELNSPNGIADLVAVKVSTTRRALSFASIPQRWVYPLKCLPSRFGFTTIWFAEQFGTSARYAQEILCQYRDAGFCQLDTGTKTWTKIREPYPLAQKIVAIEVKLRDWRRALYQATRYLDYATQSWVVLDQYTVTEALSHIDDFTSRGIGLMGFSALGDIDVMAQPANRGPRLSARFWQANAEISRRLESHARKCRR